jgi:aspartate-semialdehyde dehydrogenase
MAFIYQFGQVLRMVVSTYQAASGAGAAAMEELKLQSQEVHFFFPCWLLQFCLLVTSSIFYTLFLGIGRKDANMQNLYPTGCSCLLLTIP